MLKVFYDANGKPIAVRINRGTAQVPMWASLPFNPATKQWEPQSELGQLLLSEAQALPEWSNLDLSDRPDLAQPASPDWDLFYENKLEDSQIETAIANTTNKLAFQKLTAEFSKRAYGLDTDRLIQYWDATVSGLVLPLTTSQINQINEWATLANLPVRIQSNGRMRKA